MNKKIVYLIGVVLILVFAGFSFSAFQESLTPYVSFEKAMQGKQTVQVAGGLEQNSSSYDDDSQSLLFTLVNPEDAGDTIRVRYEGLKPANFEDAVSIVAIGEFNDGEQIFAANKLLVKCPSKYQGLEEAETKSYG